METEKKLTAFAIKVPELREQQSNEREGSDEL